MISFLYSSTMWIARAVLLAGAAGVIAWLGWMPIAAMREHRHRRAQRAARVAAHRANQLPDPERLGDLDAEYRSLCEEGTSQ